MDVPTYNKIETKPIFEQIVDQIKNLITSGALKAGDVLPPERNLSEIMGVNRHSLREALKVLEYMGVLKGKRGIGTIINNVGQDVLVERIINLVGFSPRQFWFELIEVRSALEPRIAALAAERARDEDLKAMEKAVKDLEAEVKKNVLRTDADERLHIALAKATYNSTFVRLTEPINSMLVEYREYSVKVPGRRKEVLEEHRRIYMAVKNRNAREAEAAMAYHLDKVEKMLREIEQVERHE